MRSQPLYLDPRGDLRDERNILISGCAGVGSFLLDLSVDFAVPKEGKKRLHVYPCKTEAAADIVWKGDDIGYFVISKNNRMTIPFSRRYFGMKTGFEKGDFFQLWWDENDQND